MLTERTLRLSESTDDVLEVMLSLTCVFFILRCHFHQTLSRLHVNNRQRNTITSKWEWMYKYPIPCDFMTYDCIMSQDDSMCVCECVCVWVRVHVCVCVCLPSPLARGTCRQTSALVLLCSSDRDTHTTHYTHIFPHTHTHVHTYTHFAPSSVSLLLQNT